MQSCGRWMVFLLAGVLLPMLARDARAACDVTAADFANTLVLDSPRGELRFNRGRAATYIDDEQRARGDAEWRFAITASEIFRPDRFHTIRILVISGEHLHGSGTTGEVAAYECAGDEMVETIRAHSAAFTLQKMSEELFRLISPEWTDRDPFTDPSKKRVQLYTWNQRLSRFVVKSDVVMPAATKLDDETRVDSKRE